MIPDRKVGQKNVVLRTISDLVPILVHPILTVHHDRARRFRNDSAYDRHRCGLAGSVVPQKNGDLIPANVHAEILHSHIRAAEERSKFFSETTNANDDVASVVGLAVGHCIGFSTTAGGDWLLADLTAAPEGPLEWEKERLGCAVGAGKHFDEIVVQRNVDKRVHDEEKVDGEQGHIIGCGIKDLRPVEENGSISSHVELIDSFDEDDVVENWF